MVEHESKSINETLRDALLEDYRARPFLPDLVHVEYDDRLTDKQVAGVVSGDWDEVHNDEFTEWVAEATVGAAREIIKETAGDILRRMITDGTLDEETDPDDIADDFEWTAEWDDVRFWLEDHDESDPLRQLAQHTPDPLVQWVPESTIELDGEDEEGEVVEDADRPVPRVLPGHQPHAERAGDETHHLAPARGGARERERGGLEGPQDDVQHRHRDSD